jgi:uncharacterized protein (DUF1800 family)
MRAGNRPARHVGLVIVLGAVWGAAVAPGLVRAEQPLPKLTASEEANHVLTRLGFGPRPGQVEEVARSGWKRWVEAQLSPADIDDETLAKRLATRCPSLRLSLTELQQLAKDDGKERERVKDELREAVLLRAVFSKRRFQEVMLEFWRNHFNVDVNKVPFLATHFEEHVLREHAFGKFEDLLLATARHPAMLVYLDNYVSNRAGLNENYAREVMELHTLGVDNYYTQKDVVALARVLTGWTCGWTDGSYAFFFDTGAHDPAPATVVGLAVDGKGGVADGEKVLRHLANHEGTAHFICTKLCRYLVNDDPPAALVDDVVGVFRKTGGDLREVYRAIIFSPDFISRKNYRAKFKTPFDFVVSTLRITSSHVNSPPDLFHELQLMGQPIYECVEPTGYSHQREAWLDPGVMVYRWNFALALVQDKQKGAQVDPSFTEEILKPTQAGRTRKVMQLILPGVHDPATERLLVNTADIRGLVALALGAPGFQQR